jgi:hypothetical protein
LELGNTKGYSNDIPASGAGRGENCSHPILTLPPFCLPSRSALPVEDWYRSLCWITSEALRETERLALQLTVTGCVQLYGELLQAAQKTGFKCMTRRGHQAHPSRERYTERTKSMSSLLSTATHSICAEL